MARPPVPIDVRQALRREVKFGCPVCRRPFLEFHHFDPPWDGPDGEHHFRPNGMIALCPECHRAAAHWTKEKCHKLKSPQNTRLAKPVRGFFDAWANDVQMLVRLGGNYSLGTDVPIIIGNDAIFRLSKDAESGFVQLSFDLRDKCGDAIVQMQENDFVLTPSSVHDLQVTVTKHQLKIWVSRENVGLDLSFRWLTWDKLVETFDKDWRPSAKSKRTKAVFSGMTAGLPAGMKEQFESDMKQSAAEHDEQARQMLRKEVEEKCMRNGKIPLLDIRKMDIYHRGVKTVVDNGIYTGKGWYAGNLFIGNSFQLPAYERTAVRDAPLYLLSNGRAVDNEPRKEFDSVHFSRVVVVIDGKKFVKCNFVNCDLVYKGGEVPVFDGCDLNGSLWVFDEAARRSLEWLHRVCHAFGPHGNQAFQQVIDDLKKRPTVDLPPSRQRSPVNVGQAVPD